MKFVGNLLAQHCARYPAMGLEDVYKLLHQAALGNAHAIGDAAQVYERLEQEMHTMGEGSAESLLDPISPDGKLARVHLRPYRAAGGDLRQLAQAFVATAQNWQPSRDKLERFCNCLGDFAGSGEVPLEPERVREYVARIAAAGYPLVHHSAAYRASYRPAYRVVNLDLLDIANK